MICLRQIPLGLITGYGVSNILSVWDLIQNFSFGPDYAIKQYNLKFGFLLEGKRSTFKYNSSIY